MCTFLLFFIKKREQTLDFGIMWIPSTPMIPDGFWHFSGAMRVISGPQECSEDIQSGSTCEKHDFRCQIHWFPPCGPGSGWGWIWEENQWFSAVRGSSAGNRWSNSTETIQKLHFWACKSSPEHPGGSRSRNIPEFLIVHILYKSFKGSVTDVN